MRFEKYCNHGDGRHDKNENGNGHNKVNSCQLKQIQLLNNSQSNNLCGKKGQTMWYHLITNFAK